MCNQAQVLLKRSCTLGNLVYTQTKGITCTLLCIGKIIFVSVAFLMALSIYLFTASIGSVDLLYPSVFIYCVNLHQTLILCSMKAMMIVKLYFHTSYIYLISLVSLDPSGFHL